MPTLKQKLRDGRSRVTANLCTIPSAVVTQALAAAGSDSVIIDMEHGAIDFASAHAMIAATAGTDCAPLVRVTQNEPGQVKRVLDLGATGIVFPMIRTAQDAADAVASLRYPPAGNRGFGPFIAQSRWQTDLMGYRPEMEEEMVAILLVETKDAIENIEAICAVDGIDAVIPAQFDLSTDLGIPGQFDHPEFVAAIEAVEAAAKSRNIALGNVALSQPQAQSLFDRGYRLIAGFDAIWLRAKAEEAQGWTKS